MTITQTFNLTCLQPFLTSDVNHWTVPVHLTIPKLVRFGRQPISLGFAVVRLVDFMPRMDHTAGPAGGLPKVRAVEQCAGRLRLWFIGGIRPISQPLHSHRPCEEALMSKQQLGGFGVGSDFTGQAFGGAGFQVKPRIALMGGYRHLRADYVNEGFVFRTTMNGIVLGAKFKL